jgi:shikimate kinase
MSVLLVGLMGAGKTTVGRQLAKRRGCQFLDTDHEIERRTGVRIPMIFDIEGEAGFRDRETTILREVVNSAGHVIATGGGIVLRPENRALLKSAELIIYLHASPNTLYSRTRNDHNRPLLKVEDPLKRLEELYSERDPLYREVATLVIQSQGGSVASMVRQIEGELAKCAN